MILTSLLPLDTGLALASATEARLYLLQRSSSGSTPASPADKNTLPSLQESLLQELELCPPSLPNVPSPAGGGQVGVITLEDVLQARTVLAWIYSLRGEWGSALKVVPSEEELLGEWNGGVGKAEYFGVARIKALVLRGLLTIILNTPNRAFPQRPSTNEIFGGSRNCPCPFETG